jgi:hypothetical protein
MSDWFDDLEDFAVFDDVVSGNVRDPVFIVYRHEDIQTMLRDNETFSSNVVIQIFGDVFGHGVMLGMDEPVHGRLRSLVTKASTQKALSRWEDQVVGRIGNEPMHRCSASPGWRRGTPSCRASRFRRVVGDADAGCGQPAGGPLSGPRREGPAHPRHGVPLADESSRAV